MSFIFIALGLYLTYKLSSSLFKKIDKGIERVTGTVVSSVGRLVGSGTMSVSSSSIVRNIIKKPLLSLEKKSLNLGTSVVGNIRDSAKRKIKDLYNKNVKPIIDDDINKSLGKMGEKVDTLKEGLVDKVSTVVIPLTSTTGSLNLIGKILDRKKIPFDSLFEKEKNQKFIEFNKNENNVNVLEELLGHKLDELIAISKGNFIQLDVNGKIKKFNKDKVKNIDNDELNKIVGFIVSTIKEKQNEAKINGQVFTEKDVKIISPDYESTIKVETNIDNIDAINKDQSVEIVNEKNKVENNQEVKNDIDGSLSINNKVDQSIDTGTTVEVKNENKTKVKSGTTIDSGKVTKKIIERDARTEKTVKETLSQKDLRDVNSRLSGLKSDLEIEKREVKNEVNRKPFQDNRIFLNTEELLNTIKQFSKADLKDELVNLNTLLINKLEGLNKLSKQDNKIKLDETTLAVLINSFKGIKLKVDDVSSPSRIMSEQMLQKLDSLSSIISSFSQQIVLEKEQLINYLSVSNDKLISTLSSVTQVTNVNMSNSVKLDGLNK